MTEACLSCYADLAQHTELEHQKLTSSCLLNSFVKVTKVTSLSDHHFPASEVSDLEGNSHLKIQDAERMLRAAGYHIPSPTR